MKADPEEIWPVLQLSEERPYWAGMSIQVEMPKVQWQVSFLYLL